jgi:hypothetical protein
MTKRERLRFTRCRADAFVSDIKMNVYESMIPPYGDTDFDTVLSKKVKKRGNFILATTDYFSEGTPEENIHAFAQAGLKYGRY